MRKLFFLLIAVVSCSFTFAQGERDLKVVKERYEALMADGKKKEADSLRREYMSRCPVVQIEDKDTYLFLNDLLFQNPYSNEFEYGAYAYRKMVWDRVEKKEAEGREATLRSIFKGMSSGVSKNEEIDKRFEALNSMKRTLGREVSNLCEPKYRESEYVMPSFDAKKVQILENISRKLGDDALLFRISNAKAISEERYDDVVRTVSVFSSIGSTSVPVNYFVSLMSVVANHVKDKNVIDMALECTKNASVGNETGYSLALSKFYFLAGDEVNGAKYKKMYDDEEARRNAKFGDLFKSFEK